MAWWTVFESNPRSDLKFFFAVVFFFFFTLVTGPIRSLSLKLSDTRVYEPQIRARLGTTAHLCKVVVLDLNRLSLRITTCLCLGSYGVPRGGGVFL